MYHDDKAPDGADKLGGPDDEMTKKVAADFRAMMEEAMAEAREHLSDDPDELAYVEANYAQLMKGQALQGAAQDALAAGDVDAAAALDRQKTDELAEVVARAGKRGGLLARLSGWIIRRRLGR